MTEVVGGAITDLILFLFFEDARLFEFALKNKTKKSRPFKKEKKKQLANVNRPFGPWYLDSIIGKPVEKLAACIFLNNGEQCSRESRNNRDAAWGLLPLENNISRQDLEISFQFSPTASEIL